MPGRFLPAKWRVPQINGLRGIALVLGGAYCFVRAYAYGPLAADAELPSGLVLISGNLTIEFWAGVWALIGVVCLVGAFLRKYDYIAWGLVVGMMTAWAAAYFLGWSQALAAGESSREWLTATTYGLPAAMLWLLSLRRRGDDAA